MEMLVCQWMPLLNECSSHTRTHVATRDAEDGAPYLTIWDGNRCRCTRDEEGIDVVNVHAALAKQRDDGKRFYDDMHHVDQKILDDFDTGKSKKAKQDCTTPKMKPFRCKLQIHD